MHSMKYSSIEFEVNIPETQIACELESNVVDLPQRSVKEHIEYAFRQSNWSRGYFNCCTKRR